MNEKRGNNNKLNWKKNNKMLQSNYRHLFCCISSSFSSFHVFMKPSSKRKMMKKKNGFTIFSSSWPSVNRKKKNVDGMMKKIQKNKTRMNSLVNINAHVMQNVSLIRKMLATFICDGTLYVYLIFWIGKGWRKKMKMNIIKMGRKKFEDRDSS